MRLYGIFRVLSAFLLMSVLTISTPCIAQISSETIDPAATEQWDPIPPEVKAQPVLTPPPSDAIVLFDGTNLNEWTKRDTDEPIGWQLDPQAGTMTVEKGMGDIKTKREFGDIQLHLEFRTPAVVESEGQGRGNSGVFLQGRYEVQVLDSYFNRTYSNGQAGAIYKQHAPLVNASRPPGDWQSYDVIYTAPRFNASGRRIIPARITVLHNGVLIQNNVEVYGTTEYRGLPRNIAHGPDGIILQDHGNPVSYRNIWVREL